jgi:alanine racemase
MAALEGGASCFGVATLAEGVELRRSGIEAPVLVLDGSVGRGDPGALPKP